MEEQEAREDIKKVNQYLVINTYIQNVFWFIFSCVFLLLQHVQSHLRRQALAYVQLSETSEFFFPNRFASPSCSSLLYIPVF